ncbi:MAG: J domain-containing protein [Xanthomonadales bacterium]|nr:J domain-containing protein [Xanthomonadales bacterium]
MADDTDFIGLYRELDIGADCDPEAFRLAYRRRVADLHPDRTGDPAAAEALKSLNLRYAAALAFAREHGRLPGSVPSASRSAPRPAPASARGGGLPASRAQPPAAGGLLRVLLLVAVVIGAIWMFLPAGDGEGGGAPGHFSGAAATLPVAARRPAGAPLALGQDGTTVRAGQGEPVSRSSPRWLYGPSWIEFHCDRVVDWYSSPLRPLNSSADRPPTGPAADRRPCPQAVVDGAATRSGDRP